jgi:hypothetical protein
MQGVHKKRRRRLRSLESQEFRRDWCEERRNLPGLNVTGAKIVGAMARHLLSISDLTQEDFLDLIDGSVVFLAQK